MPTARTLRNLAFALGGLAALAALVELGRLSDPGPEDAIAREVQLTAALARCRALAPEDLADNPDCRVAWDAEWRRFLGLPPGPAGTE